MAGEDVPCSSVTPQAAYKTILTLRLTTDQALAILLQNVQQSVIAEPWSRIVEGVLYGASLHTVVHSVMVPSLPLMAIAFTVVNKETSARSTVGEDIVSRDFPLLLPSGLSGIHVSSD
jgi:hypothetical protein